jgi:hypothetical protein
MVPPKTRPDGVPVVVVHHGWTPYVEPCLRKAVDSNPHGRVVLIGDDASANVGIGEHHRLDDPSLLDDVREFQRVYEHLSSSKSEIFERFCIERWFFVRNFMRRERLDRCLVIDSDVLLFCDVTEEAGRFHDVAMTFARWDPVRLLPHCNFVGCRDAIESFCRYVLHLYGNPSLLDAVKARNSKKFVRHWVSDMSLFHEWSSSSDFPIGMLEDAIRQGVGYDDCIDRTGSFRRHTPLPGVLRPWKRIEYRDGVPHGTHLRSGDVQMKCLHFHGAFKDLMDRHARGLGDGCGAAAIMLRRKLVNVPKKTTLFATNYLSMDGRRAA